MDTKQYLLNNNYSKSNDYNINNGGLNPAPIDIKTNNPQNNIPPEEIYQYPNSSDFPQYNQIVDSNKPQIDYSKYTNLNQLNHRGIIQKNENTFYIPERCCSCGRWFPVIYFTFGFSFCFILLLEITVGTVIFALFGLFFASLGLVMLCKAYHSFYFVLNSDNIKLICVARCGRKSIVYRSGQITQVIFTSSLSLDTKGKNIYKYELKIQQNIPGEDSEFIVFGESSGDLLYTEEEIGFFNYIMNHHIQSKLNNNINNMN